MILPEDQREFFDLNTELSLLWPVISSIIEAPPDAAEWDEGKKQTSVFGTMTPK